MAHHPGIFVASSCVPFAILLSLVAWATGSDSGDALLMAIVLGSVMAIMAVLLLWLPHRLRERIAAYDARNARGVP